MTVDPHSHLPKPEPYQRFGSGDGERKTLLTRQIAFESLPASVLFALLDSILKCDMVAGWDINNWLQRKGIRSRR